MAERVAPDAVMNGMHACGGGRAPFRRRPLVCTNGEGAGARCPACAGLRTLLLAADNPCTAAAGGGTATVALHAQCCSVVARKPLTVKMGPRRLVSPKERGLT